MSVKILSTADIHIGRCSSRLPELEHARRYSSARMWHTIVDRAIQEKVDLVTLSGDIVDHDNRFFEATGPLETGLLKLANAGIHTYAVSGNHDYDVLPRLIDSVGTDYFHLLGRNGKWEQTEFERDGKPVLRIHGWSFPSSHVQSNPVSGWSPTEDHELPVIGLLHADLDVPDSRYAPVLRSELQSHDLTMWLLGHVHRPQLWEASSAPTVLYPGSPQAMDPGETGAHGPWLIEIQSRYEISARQIALSKVRYETLDVDLTETESKAEFENRLLDSTGQYLKEVAGDAGSLEFLSLRINLTGRTSISGLVDEYSESLCEQFERSTGTITARIDTVTNNTLPQVDLNALAEKHDPPGVLAQTILALHSVSADDRVRDLLRDSHQKHLEVFRANAYNTLGKDTEPDLDATRRRLIRQGTRLLDRLLAQERSA